MAQRDDVPKRNLDPHLFTKDQSVEKPSTAEVWVTPSLQAAAQAYYNSKDITRTETLGDLDAKCVAIKFKNTSAKKQFLIALKPFAQKYKEGFSTNVPLPDEKSDSTSAVLRIELFLPEIFSEVVTDLAMTKLTAVPIQPGLAELAKLYLAAFSLPIVRVDLLVDLDADHATSDQLEKTLGESQRRLVTFLKELVPSLPSDEAHRVILHGINEIEVDGNLKDIKGAARRALLALALFPDKRAIKTKDFAKVYNGKNSVEARHDFDNAMKALKVVLPRIESDTSGKGTRTVKNLTMKVEVAEAEIKSHLQLLYQ